MFGDEMSYFSKLTFKRGLRDGIPIALGYLSVSFAFGVQASNYGIPALVATLISMTNLTSAGQLQGIMIIAAVGTILEIIVTQIVINARYFLMSVSLSQKLGKNFTLPLRLLCSAGITDEIYAVAINKPTELNPRYFLGLMLLPYVGWTSGTVIGALLGNVLPNAVSSALGIALYAMFIAIIVPPMTKNKGITLCIIISVSFSVILYFVPFLSVLKPFAVIISALISAIIVAIIFPVKLQNGTNDAVPNDLTTASETDDAVPNDVTTTSETDDAVANNVTTTSETDDTVANDVTTASDETVPQDSAEVTEQ